MISISGLSLPSGAGLTKRDIKISVKKLKIIQKLGKLKELETMKFINGEMDRTLESDISKNFIVIFLFIFLFLRIIFCYYLGWEEIPKGSDGNSYNGYALAILHNDDWLSNPDFDGDYRPPGYPLMLAIIYFIFGENNYFAVFCVQAIVSAVTIYYIYLLSKSTLKSKKSALLTLLWAGLYLPYFMYSGNILREILVYFLITFTFYQLWQLFHNKKNSIINNFEFWKFSIAFLFLLHVDERFLFYIPIILLLFIIYKGTWLGLKQYSIFIAILLLLMVPWTIRNFIAYDEFVLINTRTLGKNIRGLVKIKNAKDETKTKYYRDYPSEEERALIKQGKNPKNRSKNEIEIIKKNVYPPKTKIHKIIYRSKEMWLPFRFWSDYDYVYNTAFRGPWSIRHNIASIIFYGSLIPFFIYGTINIFRNKVPGRWLIIAPVISHALLHFITAAGRERYRIQIDSFIIIIGCYGIIAFYYILKKKLSKTEDNYKLQS